RPDQQILYEVMGRDWQGEPYVIGYRPKTVERFDVGLNCTVETPHRNRTWPAAHWEALHDLLAGRYAVSVNPNPADLRGTIDWIASCRVVVSPDALGLHLALALGRKAVGLFGPTPAACCYAYDRALKLTPPIRLNCIPCCLGECRYEKGCLQTILPERVADAVDTLAHARVPGS
ncbi:MAG TPA: glycosyltransferase family 9 protein, partial [Planctomycetota bacterium]|nr:glycosyltransferase family 9 protein [Planctomycetota bacterium]